MCFAWLSLQAIIVTMWLLLWQYLDIAPYSSIKIWGQPTQWMNPWDEVKNSNDNCHLDHGVVGATPPLCCIELWLVRCNKELQLASEPMKCCCSNFVITLMGAEASFCLESCCCINVVILVGVVMKVMLLERVWGPKMSDSSHCIVESKHDRAMLWRETFFFFFFLNF